MLWLNPQQRAGRPVVESFEGPPNPGVHHTGLQYNQEGHLYDCHVKCARVPGNSPLLDQNPGHPSPLPLGPPQIVKYCHPVFF